MCLDLLVIPARLFRGNKKVEGRGREKKVEGGRKWQDWAIVLSWAAVLACGWKKEEWMFVLLYLLKRKEHKCRVVKKLKINTELLRAQWMFCLNYIQVYLIYIWIYAISILLNALLWNQRCATVKRDSLLSVFIFLSLSLMDPHMYRPAH